MLSDLSLKERIVRYYATRLDQWINAGELEREALIAGYKASNCGRRLRELHVEGVLDRRENEKGTVEYRYKSA